MSANHTEGTWTAHAQASANNYIILKDNNWVAAIQFNGEMMVAKQDELAKVIAAGPDLLAAIKQAESLIPHLADLDNNTAAAEVVVQIRAAIAKAGVV